MQYAAITFVVMSDVDQNRPTCCTKDIAQHWFQDATTGVWFAVNSRFIWTTQPSHAEYHLFFQCLTHCFSLICSFHFFALARLIFNATWLLLIQSHPLIPSLQCMMCSTPLAIGSPSYCFPSTSLVMNKPIVRISNLQLMLPLLPLLSLLPSWNQQFHVSKQTQLQR